MQKKIGLKKLIIFLGFNLIFYGIFISCEYQFKTENYIEISKPDTTRSVVVQLSLDITDYNILSYTDISYDLDLGDLTLHKIHFYLDDVLIYVTDQSNGWFHFRSEDYDIGYHKLTAIVVSNTNTKSIADLIASEELTFKHEWRVYIDNQPPQTPVIQKIGNENGVLKLEWEKYTRKNFLKYVIYRTREEIDCNMRIKVAEIQDSLRTNWVDSSYLGGKCEYWLSIVAGSYEQFSDKQTIDYALPQLDTIWTNEDSACFTWDEKMFYGVTKKLELQCKSYYATFPEVLYSSTIDSVRSVVVKNLRFGGVQEYRLIYNPNENELWESAPLNYNYTTLRFFMGNNYPILSACYPVCSKNFFLACSDNKLYKIDKKTGQISAQSIPDPFGVYKIDEENKQVVMEGPNRFDIYDLETFNFIGSKNFNGFNFYSNSFSTNGRVFVSLGLGMVLINFDTMGILLEEKDYAKFPLELSSDGQFAYHYDYLDGDYVLITFYRLIDNQLVYHSELPARKYSFFKWNNGANAQLLYVEGYLFNTEGVVSNKLALYDVSTGNFLYQKSIPVGGLCGIDPCNHTMAFSTKFKGTDNYNKLVVIDYLNGEVKQQLNLTPEIGRINYCANHVFSSNGYSYKLNNQ